MTSSFEGDDYVDKISYELSQALQSQSEVEDELFCILVHVSPFLGHVIPLRSDVSSSFNEKKFMPENRAAILASKQTCLVHVKSIIDQLEAYYLVKVKEMFADCSSNQSSTAADLSNNHLNAVCIYLEKLQVLIGHKQAVEKFKTIISRHIDTLLQQFSLYDQNAVSNLSKLSKEYISLFTHVKVIIHQVIFVLSCAKVFKDKSRQLSFIKEVILEKLSIELLTLSGSVKDNLTKSSSRPKQSSKPESSASKQRIKFLSNITTDEMQLSAEMLSDFAAILEEYLTLEKILESSDILTVLDYKNSNSKKSVLKQHSLELPDLIKTSQHSFLQSSSRFSKWEWCETLQEFAPLLSSGIISCLQQTSNSLIEKTKKQFQNNLLNELETFPAVSRLLTSIIKGQPKKILKCIGTVLQLIITWLPFGIIGKKHRFMSKLHSDFLDVVNQVLKESKQFLTDILEEIPEKICVSFLPLILATSFDVVIVLQHCEEKLQHDNRLPFTGSIKLYISLCNHIHQIMLQYHKAQLAATILHDAESNYWSDPRAFAEGERCSYSVEMWQSYLTNLHQESFETLGYDMTQQIVSEIFADSVSILANRYCNCKPSDRRQDQIRMDVSEILRFCLSFLWKILPSSFAICPNTSSAVSSTPNVTCDKIHASCKDLFCCLTVLASPLTEFYEVVRLIDQSEIQSASTFKWMTALNVSIFPVGWNGKCNSLSDDSYTFCILKHLFENPDKRLVLSLEAMTSRQCFLFKKLFLSKSQMSAADAKILESLLTVSSFQESVTCDILLGSGENMLFTDLKFFWEKRESYLPWQVILRHELLPHIGNVLLPALHFMSLHCLSSFSKNLCKKLPAEVVASIPGVYNEDTRDILHYCTILILQGLRSFALSLSPFVASLFAAIDKRLHKKSSNLVLLHDSYGAHVLLHLASAYLTHNDLLQSLCVELTPAVISALHEIARFLLEMNNLQANPAEGSEKSNEQLIQEVASYRDTIFSLFSHTLYVEEAKEFGVAKFNHLRETGSISKSDLRAIRHLSKWLMKNFKDIVQQLDINLSNISKETTFVLEQTDSAFSPEWDWKPAILGTLTSNYVDSVIHLLCQRPELQENAYLSEQEKEKVPFIKYFFNLSGVL